MNIKTIYAGGLRNTPIDLNESELQGETVYKDDEAYSLKAKDYVSNTKNIFGDYFDPLSGTTKTSYQAPLIPILSYKMDF